MLKVSGLSQLRTRVAEVPARLDEATRAAATAGAQLIGVETQRLLSLRSHPRGTPTPSPPGAPPARISGDLRDSVHTGVAQGGSGTYRATVQSGLAYSWVQEHGGRVGRGSVLPPRPYIKSARDNVALAAVRLAGEIWMAALAE
jgi:hypothetical protein